MKFLWDKLIDEFLTYDIDIDNALNPGAGEHEVLDAENKLQIKFPDDFVEFYQIHNGQDEMADYLFYGHELLSMQRIISEWKIWKQLYDKGTFVKNGQSLKSKPDTGVKNDWWNPKWIPFTYDGRGNHYCLDLDPESEGTFGQVIVMYYDDPVRKICANSFTEFIKMYIEDLMNGNFIIETYND